MMDTKDNVFREASLKGVDVEDLKLATSKMKGIQRRTFQAEIVLKYCGGNVLLLSLAIFFPNIGEDGISFWNFFWGFALTTARKR